MSANMSRRGFVSGALALVGGCVASLPVVAAQNANLRASLKYQDKPSPDGKTCETCTHFVLGKSNLGGCKIIPGDDGIATKGYCVAWAKKT